jgi:hypothetical protein
MPRTRVMFKAGDRVRVQCRLSDGLYRGEVPNGTEGIVRGLREVQTPFDAAGQTTTAAVVYFPGVGERIAFPNVLDLVRVADDIHPCSNHPQMTCMHASHGAAGFTPGSDTKAQRLARAHKAVAEAYNALAYALNDLKAEEAR